MTPRIQFTAVPQAFNSEKINGLTSSQLARSDANNILTGSQNIQNTATSAFVLQKASAGTVLLQADTTNSVVGIGGAPSGSGSTLQVSGSTSITGALTLGTASSISGQLVFNSATTANTVSLQGGATSGTYSLTLPTAGVSGSQCLQSTAGSTVSATALQWGVCGGGGGTYLNKNSTDTSAAAITASNYLYSFTNSSTGIASGVLSLSNGTNTNSTLYVTASGNPTSGQALIFASNTNAAPSGNLLDLQSGSAPSSKFSVDASGNVVVNGSYNSNSFSATNLTFSGVSPVIGASTINTGITLQANGTGTLLLGTTGAGTVSIANANATTLNLAANDVVHAIHLGDGGSTTVQTVTLGSLNSTSATTVQGGSGNINLTVNQSGAGVIVKTATNNSATALQVQNNAGNSILGVDTSASQVLLGKASTVGGQLVVYGATSGSVTISVPAAVNGGVNYNLVLPSTPGSATQCLQNSSTPGTLQWGSCGGGGGGVIRTITLVPEYPGGVLHASGSNNSGTMTSEYDSTNVHSYYQWSSSLGALNNYDIIERTLIPSEYSSALGNLKIWVYNDSTVATNNDIQVSVRAPDGTACATTSSILNTATIDTWVQQTVSLSGCTASNFSANGILGIDIKLLAQNNNNVRVGEISYQYTN